PASAQVSATAPGPYYATPSWDQKLTTNRFVVLSNWNNEAVLDRETGIVWDVAPIRTFTLQGVVIPLERDFLVAREDCIILARGGKRGWRSPSIAELTSLLPLPDGHPFHFAAALPVNFWSATANVRDATQAYTVDSEGSVHIVPKAQGGGTFSWC